jgi:excisionase family DNA binding protein
VHDDPQFSPGEAAIVTGTPRRTILAAVASGELPAARFNRRVLRISRRDLLAWRIAKMQAQSAQLAQLDTTRTTPARPSRRPDLP